MTAAVLTLILVSAVFSSCSGKDGSYAMSLEKTYISGSEYAYYLACYKQYWLYSLGKTDSKEFWESENEGVKNADRLTEITRDALKKRLVSAYLFDSYGLSLTDSELHSIDLMIAGMKASSGQSDPIKEDEVFKTLGIDETDLKNIMIKDSKTGALQDYLYGDEGIRKITDEKTEKFYKENYYKFKFVYFMDGDFLRDEDGNIEYTEDGAAKVEEISDERYEEKLALAKKILSEIREGAPIDGYVDEYSEQLEKDDYKNGHYLCYVNEYGTLLSAAVMKLGIGETGLLDTKYGIYVIQRCELDDLAWKDPENEAGNDFYSLSQLVTEEDFDAFTQEYYDKIKINEETVGKYKMEDLPYTFSWQYMF